MKQKISNLISEITFFHATFAFFSVLALGVIQLGSVVRSPAQAEPTYTLHIQSLKLDVNSKIKSLDGTTLRATFARVHKLDVAAISTLSPGEMIDVDAKVPIVGSWIQGDRLEFKLEIVRKGWLETVVARCAQVSKSIASYNRSYQCTLPGEQIAILTYRLSQDGSTSFPIASNNQ